MTSEGRLAGKAALVTGASRGVGRAIAERLASEGARVAVCYLADRDAAEAVAAGIAARGGEALAVQADIGRLADIDALFAALDRAWGVGGRPYLDIVVNNAALGGGAQFDKVDEAEFDRVMAVNLKGPFFVIQRGLRRMRDGGRVVNISALGARRAYPDVPVYTPAKAGLNTLTALLARDAGLRGITVNGVAPGAVETDMTAARLRQPGALEDYARRTPLGRIGQPGDIAEVVLFLASKEGGWITGETLTASGGLGL
ncbi:SDR family NAD(P)-dependent oxidoreductase [Phenylobacterium sp.]|jgi:NAD(P)-dependent dehydrogenase (short-subunit alcohol dehydrogenase family)|uniref:SDR family NAD(P)-dependent oxidoreductase n=1 Tax=Phenylobacterium sp. TaxID=1871053 RepID=UPI002F3E6840